MKGDVWLIFWILLILILIVYYVGFISDTLAFTKAIQQLGYFLTGRTSAGNYTNQGITVGNQYT